MKKIILSILMATLSLSLIVLTACGNPAGNSGTPQIKVLPTATEIISAREKVNNENEQGYDFTVNFSGEISALGFSGNVSANYDGQYRYNKTSGETTFKRTTSGLLLNDSTAYVFTQGSHKIKLVLEDDGSVKKTSVLHSDEEELLMINKPLVAIIDALRANNLSNIKENNDANESEYEYSLKINIESSNSIINKALGVIGKLGTNISFKDVEFTNPVGGITLYFNLENEKLTDFKFGAQISFPIKAVDVTFDFYYEQKSSNVVINVPTTVDLITNANSISSEVNVIKNSILDYKDDEDFSLDLVAKNDFDPAWNITATVDKFTSRLYKNTVEEDVWFNNSFVYKAHDEEDGAEAYKYTIGNLNNDEQSVHIVSRKSKNTVEKIEGVSIDERFDYLTSAILNNLTSVDCIRKTTNGTKTTYKLYVNDLTAISLQDNILDLINTNPSESVIMVNNNFNTQSYIVEDAEFIIEMENGKVTKISCETEIKYEPTGGTYTEYNVTLKNQLELEINKNIEKASKYESPDKDSALAGFAGLIAAKYYIL